ncbi:MAG: hypothetical protein M3Y74_14695, partial [Chloroflexota bacterium]|nr:hypothetical protein [Chloroflexota bacterium]
VPTGRSPAEAERRALTRPGGPYAPLKIAALARVTGAIFMPAPLKIAALARVTGAIFMPARRGALRGSRRGQR